jgi:hypothetical protein
MPADEQGDKQAVDDFVVPRDRLRYLAADCIE